MILEVQKTTCKGVMAIAKLTTVAFTVLAIFFTIALIMYPDTVLSASLRGMDLWATKVFPSLLPFFIIAELLFGFGVVHGVGALCERFMRPLFNVPGAGGFVWVMGMVSGYPAGAKWTRDLRENGQVTKVEAERLVAFTNASSPLFLFGVVAGAFFGNTGLGLMIAAAHYGGNFLVGLGMRFYRYGEDKPTGHSHKKSVKEALHILHHTRINDGRPLGQLLGDAVMRSIKTLILVGGFIMLFSVVTDLLKQTGVIHLSSLLLTLFGIPEVFQLPLTAGLFEITTGVAALTDTNTSLLAQLVFVSFILGFHGLSIQAQIASILADTDIRFAPYAWARLAHGTIAAVLMVIFYQYFDVPEDSVNVWTGTHDSLNHWMAFFEHYGPIFTFCLLSLSLYLFWMKKRG
ncbi:sporulation integral membrane protein YlbJ [Halobacillus naozhouensis]|uniref:Sporulation integral membrane protein YlbJ n=2 Tax=Halobacillus naozhouensis TaxID=554880 RepID=A0ABY8J3H7_9BACI|nr:sporulation integral membrane protein YlbJ [Halobacillus naozhouensis]WFT76627.1 sporulation integral membrane protein YlbJ [Halobacillus naozhouensis]